MEVIPFQEYVFALPLVLHNRCSGLFTKLSLNPEGFQPRLSPACHPSITQSWAKHPSKRKMLTRAIQPFLRGRSTLSNEILTLASLGHSHLHYFGLPLTFWQVHPGSIRPGLLCHSHTCQTTVFISLLTSPHMLQPVLAWGPVLPRRSNVTSKASNR